jgi:hypothetical protein
MGSYCGVRGSRVDFPYLPHPSGLQFSTLQVAVGEPARASASASVPARARVSWLRCGVLRGWIGGYVLDLYSEGCRGEERERTREERRERGEEGRGGEKRGVCRCAG